MFYLSGAFGRDIPEWIVDSSCKQQNRSRRLWGIKPLWQLLVSCQCGVERNTMVVYFFHLAISDFAMHGRNPPVDRGGTAFRPEERAEGACRWVTACDAGHNTRPRHSEPAEPLAKPSRARQASIPPAWFTRRRHGTARFGCSAPPGDFPPGSCFFSRYSGWADSEKAAKSDLYVGEIMIRSESASGLVMITGSRVTCYAKGILWR